MEEGKVEIDKEKVKEKEMVVVVVVEEEEEVDGCTDLTAGGDDQSECLPVVSVAGSFHQSVLASNPRNQV